MGGIYLHPKYGVNPTLPVCFWCGEERGEVALLGRAYKGEAPRRMVIDKVPCDACKEKFAKGIALLEATQDWSTRYGKYLPDFTGRYLVVTEEAVRALFQPESVVEEVLKARKACLEPEAFNKLMEQAGLATKSAA